MTAPAAPPPERAALWEDFLEIFIKPADVFERRRASGFAIPLLVLTVLFAVLFFGLKGAFQPMMDAENARAIARVMAKNPQIKAVVHSAWKENALDRLNDSMDAMYEVAATPDYKGKGDRELHFKVAGILNDTVIVDKTGNVDLSKLSFEEKMRLAGLDNPEALIALRTELAKRRAEMEALSVGDDEESNAVISDT